MHTTDCTEAMWHEQNHLDIGVSNYTKLNVTLNHFKTREDTLTQINLYS